jgi:hypothetical protein
MNVGEIKEAVGKLTPAELAEVSAFIAQKEAKDWDAKIDADFSPGWSVGECVGGGEGGL